MYCMKKENKKNKKEDLAGFAVPAGIFLGMGFGFLYGPFLAGLFIGLGTGFVAMIILKLILKEKRQNN